VDWEIESVFVFCVHRSGELTAADTGLAFPFPEIIPPKVVDPVPPTFTVKVEDEVKAEVPAPIKGWPKVNVVPPVPPLDTPRVPVISAVSDTEAQVAAPELLRERAN
jgi:hypothetical protein